MTLRGKHRLRTFENKALGRTFGPRREEVMGGWRKLHNEELYNLYSSPSNGKVKEDEIGMACSMNREKENTNKLLVGKPERKRPLERPRRRWMDNFKIYLGNIG
jgi:hypothetical protein